MGEGYRFTDINQARSVPSWRYRVQLPADLPGLTPPPGYLVASSSIPIWALENEARFIGGTFRYFPKEYQVDSLDLTFLEQPNFSVFNFFQKWFNMVVRTGQGNLSRRGVFGRPGGEFGYAKNIIVSRLTHQGEVGLRLEYKECWPMRITQTEASSDQSAPVITSVSISVNDVEPTVYDRTGSNFLMLP